MTTTRAVLIANARRVVLIGLTLLLGACGRAEARETAPSTSPGIRTSVPVSYAGPASAPASAQAVGLGREPTFAVVGGAGTERVANLGALLERLPFRAALPTYAPAGLWLDIAGVSGVGEGQPANFSMYFLTADETQGLLLAQGPGQGEYASPPEGSVPPGVDVDVQQLTIRAVSAVLVRVKVEGSPFSSNLYWQHCGVGFNLRGTGALLDGTTIFHVAESTMHPCD